MQNLCRNVEDEVTVVHKNDVTPEKMYQLILARSQACVIAPSRTGSEPVPVVIFFHGAGHVDSGVQNQLQKLVNDYHFILLAPYSAMDSWDLLRGGWGEDARAVRRYLAWLREHYSVDERRISMMGFSDGASYALTLGGRSKDIRGIAAFSPGFCLGNISARRVFISHAENDAVLPYSVARKIALELQNNNKEVIFVTHHQGHLVPITHVKEALIYCLNSNRTSGEM